MNDSKISVRYAKAIFKLALENNILPRIKQDMEILYETCEIPIFNEFLHSPIIQISEKQKILQSLFKEKVHKYTLSFLNILATNRRETFLQIISLNYFTFYREILGIKEIVLTSSTALTADTKAKIISTLKQLFKSEIELKEKVNKEIIGGFIIKIDDQQIDASVKTKLSTLKKDLVK